MNIFLPENIFTRFVFHSLSEEDKKLISFKSSASISAELKNDKQSIALIPALDLISNKDFFISKSFGLSFDGSLCNSYIYYNKGEKDLSGIKVAGDVSTLEVILGKILFKELYNVDVEINIQTQIPKHSNSNSGKI
jgi:hypothetical protein